MAQDNCAQGAPQGRRAHAPTGFRRLTPGLLKADRTAEGFAGLPEGVTVHRAAAGRLQGGRAAARHLAAPGACGRLAVPLHPAAGLGARAAGRSCGPRPRCSRRRSACRRPRSRRSTAADRARSRHDEGQPERQALRQARPAEAASSRPTASTCRRSRCAMPNSAAWRRRAGRSASLWAACAGARRSRARPSRRSSRRPPNTASRARSGRRLARESGALARALRGVERVEEMELGVTSLERRQSAARERLESLLGVVDSDPKGPENRPHIYNYKPSL